MKNTSNENLLAVIYFSATLNLKKEPPSEKKTAVFFFFFEKLVKRANLLLLGKAILG